MKKLTKIFKTVLEYLPLMVFFTAFKLLDNNIVEATKYLVGTSILSIVIIYYIEKAVPKLMLYSTALVVIFGLITVVANDSTFIKIKPTILYLILATLLYNKSRNNKLVLKDLMGNTLDLSNDGWISLAKRLIYFFLFLALMNEFVWRVFSESWWIKFKLIGFPVLMALFLILNISLFKNNKK